MNAADTELEATARLQALSLEMIGAQDFAALCRKIVDAAASIMASRFASMQMLYPERGDGGELLLLAHHGFDPESARFWEWVRADSSCTCGVALRTRTRVIAADVEAAGFMAGTPDQRALLAAGIRAAQSTPLLSRDGSLLGMITTHWDRPYQPGERQLRLFDILARQAVDLVERRRAQEALDESEERYSRLLRLMPAAVYTCEAPSGVITYYNEHAAKLWGRAPATGETDERFCGSYRLWRPDGSPLPHDQTPMALAMLQGESFRNQEVVIERPDGSRVTVLVNIDPLRDAQGRVTGAINVFHDITERRRVDEALMASEERYRAVVESQTEMVCRFRPDGTILFVNGAYARSRGTTVEALVGKDFWAHIPEADHAGIRALLARMTPESPEVRIENRFVTTEGERWTLWTNRALAFDAQGRVAEAQSTGIDITDRKQAERRLERELAAARQLQETSVQLLQQEDEAQLYGRILEAAAGIMRSQFASLQMFHPERGAAGELRLLAYRGFSPQAAAFWEWVRPASHSACGVALRSAARCIVPDVDACAFLAGTEDLDTYRQTGIRAVQTTPLLSRSGALIGMLSTHWSEPHAPDEHDLRLLDVLARQAADLIERSKALQALQEADRRKDEFLAILSHELRNPLAPISNALTLLHQADEDAAVRHQARAVLDRQVRHLIRLVEDLLDVSRIGRGDVGLQKRVVRVAEVLGSALETSRPRVESGGHALGVDQPEADLAVEADPVRLAQVVANLINNAAAYTPHGGRIDVAVRRRGGQAEISVRDNGVGMSAEELAALFGMFRRGDVAKQHPSGFGIGLALSRRLVEMHGGTIEASSDGIGRGSQFIVRLPLAARASDAPAVEERLAASAAPRRILVVDDNRDAADSLGLVLRTLGAEVRVAHDGPGALAEFDAHTPSVVLLDIGMPGMSGYEVARAIRSRDAGRSAALVALTGWGQEEDRRRARDAGFDHHLVKPAEMEALQALIASLR